jgi:TonB family protein
LKRETGNGKRETQGASFRSLFLVFCFLAAASVVLPQTTGAKLVRQPKPVYPEGASQGQRQGNVNLIGRIDDKGKVTDIRLAGATLEAFIDPAVAAVNAWEFKPATRAGKPIDVAANIALRFRLEGDKRGDIPSPMLGDLAIFPADAAGKATGPDGYPIHRGVDARLRAEAVLDVAPDSKPRSLHLSVTALSPSGKKALFLEDVLQVKPGTKEVKIPFTEVVRPDWEDGVWLVRFVVNNADAGGGQFWLAGDPEHYHFVVSGKPPQPAASKPGGRAPAKPAAPKPARSPKPTKG